MKFLHTSDLHIGKKIIGRDRYEEYKAVLDEIYQICVGEGVEIVLVAGDIYDTYTPSAEAERIFYRGIKRIAEVCSVLVISGNHDDYVRLTAASGLAEELGVYIIGNDLRAIPPSRHNGAYPVASDSGYVIFANDKGERVYINTLPYPNEARFKEGKSDETFEQKMARWIEYGQRGNTQNLPSVFLSHIFVAGGKVGDTEREIDLGGARVVPTELLPDCAYCALGHLHRRQKLGSNAYYCGAPMRFSFDESGAKKSVNIFDITKNGLENFKQTELQSIKSLMRLQANCIEDGLNLLDANPTSYVELTLHLSAPITPAENGELHLRENLLSLKVEISSAATNITGKSNRDKSASELFCEYYRSRYDSDVPAELLSLFLSMTEEE